MHFLTGLPFSGQDEIIKLLEQNPKISLYKNSPLFNTTNSIIEQTLAQGGYDKQCPVEKEKELSRMSLKPILIMKSILMLTIDGTICYH